MPEAEDLRLKVNGLLREALAEVGFDARARLIRKAGYWNAVAEKKSRKLRASLLNSPEEEASVSDP